MCLYLFAGSIKMPLPDIYGDLPQYLSEKVLPIKASRTNDGS